MSDDRTSNGNGAPGDDAGEPATALGDLDYPTSPEFLTTLRARIERRQLTGNLASLTWHVPRVLIVEFLRMVFDLVGSSSNREGDSK